MTSSSEQPPKHIYWEKATPQDFMEANLGDWIQYVGDISTQYELIFIRNFGGFWSSRPHPSTCNIMTCEKATDGCLQTRPHPAPARIVTKGDIACINNAMLEEAARKAREDVLIDFETWAKLWSHYTVIDLIKDFRQSLRSTAPHTEQEQP